MTPAAFAAFLDALATRLAAEPAVLGLVATGSAAGLSHAPDAWSDHDFWVIAAPGAAEALRARHDWLPDLDRVVLAFRETAHGVKVLYGDGHLLEYAVFEPHELDGAKVNDYRILLDRADLAARLADVRAATRRWSAGAYTDDLWLFGQVLTLAQIAAGRHARGERLSAHAYLEGHALDLLVRLLARHLVPDRPDRFDDIDPRRRFEEVFPAAAAHLTAALAAPLPETARRFVALAEEVAAPVLGPWTARAADAVRARIAEAERALAAAC